MGAVRLLRTLAPLAVTAVLLSACGSGSSSSSAGAAGTTAPASSGSLELRPVYARYAQGVPLGDSQLGPTVPKDLLSAMRHHDCSAQPSELQGMLLICGDDKTVYLLKAPLVDGGVASAAPAHIGGQKEWYVKLSLDPQATDTLSQATQSMAGSELAIVLDNQVLSAPIIDSSMADGHVVVTGNLDQAQATKLAHRLAAGQQG
jgi:hypothetical protein